MKMIVLSLEIAFQLNFFLFKSEGIPIYLDTHRKNVHDYNHYLINIELLLLRVYTKLQQK